MPANEVKIVITAVGNAVSEINKASGALKNLASSAKTAGRATKADLLPAWLQATPAVKNLQESVRALSGDIFMAGAILTGFAVAVEKAYDFGKEGANIERLRETGTKLATSFGVDMTEAVQKIKAASLDTISANQAVAETNRLLLLGITTDTDKMAKLMQIAALRGRAFGLDSVTAFDRITLGIGRLSTRILDDIGIVIDGETTYAAYAKSIGKTSDELTEAQKRLALTNAIIENGNELLAASGGLAEDNASNFERLAANMEDFGNKLKEAVSGPAGAVVLALDKILFGTQELSNTLAAHEGEVQATSKNYAEYRAEMERAAKAAGFFIGANGDLIQTLNTGRGIVTQVIQSNAILTESEYEGAKAVDTRREAIEDMRDSMASLLAWQEKLNKASEVFDKITGKIGDQSLSKAAEVAIQYAEAMGVTGDALDQLRIQFGLLDPAVLRFREALQKAGEDGKVTADELARAFNPIAVIQYTTELNKLADEFNEKQAELAQQRIDALAELDLDFSRQQEDDQIDLDRKLSDIQADENQSEVDLERKHDRKMEDIETNYQRQVSRIMQRYEMSRLRALIDLDARALFEAEAQRDSDLANAKESRDEDREDAEEDREEEQEAIERDAEEKRRQALLDAERRRQDEQRDYDRRLRDLRDDFDERERIEKKNYQDERDALGDQLDQVEFLMNQSYQQRISDRIAYWQAIHLVDQSMGGDEVIALGGVPTTTHSCPAGYHWDETQQDCIRDYGTGGAQFGANFIVPPNPRGGAGDYFPVLAAPGEHVTVETATQQSRKSSSNMNIMVTLDVRGDGMLAQAVRESTYQALVDVVRE